MTIETMFMNAENRRTLFTKINQKDPTKVWRIRVDEYDEKTRLQEEKYHAMINDIAKQAKHLNQVFDADSWKRLLVAQFRTESIESDIPRVADYWKRTQFKLVPSLDGRSLVTLGAQTRDFPKYVAAAFITFLYAYGANNDIRWSEPENEWNERWAA